MVSMTKNVEILKGNALILEMEAHFVTLTRKAVDYNGRTFFFHKTLFSLLFSGCLFLVHLADSYSVSFTSATAIVNGAKKSVP